MEASAWYQVGGTRCLVPSIWYRVPSLSSPGCSQGIAQNMSSPDCPYWIVASPDYMCPHGIIALNIMLKNVLMGMLSSPDCQKDFLTGSSSSPELWHRAQIRQHSCNSGPQKAPMTCYITIGTWGPTGRGAMFANGQRRPWGFEGRGGGAGLTSNMIDHDNIAGPRISLNDYYLA